MPNYSAYSDQELYERLCSGDQKAFTEIYHRHKSVLYIFAYKRIGSREDAQDVLHELFLSLWDKRESLTITSGLLPYLYTSVRNRVLDKIAHRAVESRYIDQFQAFLDTDSSQTDHLVRNNELLVLIEQEINALPDKMRQVFELSRQTNLTRREIATQLHLSEETVKSHLHHALKILKSKLGPLYGLFLLCIQENI